MMEDGIDYRECLRRIFNENSVPHNCMFFGRKKDPNGEPIVTLSFEYKRVRLEFEEKTSKMEEGKNILCKRFYEKIMQALRS